MRAEHEVVEIDGLDDPNAVWLTAACGSDDESSGVARSWAYDEAARALSARARPLTRDVVAAARTIVTVSDLGVETRLRQSG